MRLPLMAVLVALLAVPGYSALDPAGPDAIVISSDDVGVLPEEAPDLSHELFAATDSHAAFTVDTCGGYVEPTATVWYAVWGDEDAPDWWSADASSVSLPTAAADTGGIVNLDSELVGDAFGWGRCCACKVGWWEWCIVYTKDSASCCCKMVTDGPYFWDWSCDCKGGDCNTS